MNSWNFFLIFVSATLVVPANLQENVEESANYERSDQRYMVDNILESMLDVLNNRFAQISSRISIPLKRTLDDVKLFGTKVWGLHTGKARGKVEKHASVIVVDIDFPYLEFTLFADWGYDEGIVALYLYDLDLRTLIYFNEENDCYCIMDFYARGYSWIMTKNEDVYGKKNNVRFTVDHSILLDVLMDSLSEAENIFDYIGPIDTDDKRRNIIGNKTAAQIPKMLKCRSYG